MLSSSEAGASALTAHSCIHHKELSLAAGNCFGQGYAPLPESVSWLLIDWFRNTKTWLPCFSLRQLWRAIPAPEHFVGWAEASAAFRVSCIQGQLLTPPNPDFITEVGSEDSAIILLHAVLCFKIYFQGTQSKTPYGFIYIFPKCELGSSEAEQEMIQN